MCNSTGLWTTMCALCNSKEKSCQRGEDIERKAWEKDQGKLEVLCLHDTGRKLHGRLCSGIEWAQV